MSGTIVDLPVGRSLPWQLIEHSLLILLITSCATGPGRGAPTSPALPSFPAITPIMPGEESSPTPPASPTLPPTAEAPASSGVETSHTVQPGDTLLGLARLYEVPIAAIQLENDMGESTVVQAGQILRIPARDDWEGSSPFWVVHEVRPNETLLGIARTHDLDLDRLQAVNGLEDADRIRIGQQLVLPLGGPAVPATPVEVEVPSPTATSEPAASATEPATPRGAATSAPTVGSGADSRAAVPANLASWPQEIFQRINEVRAEHGMAPFTYNGTLEQAAQAHANDCAQRGWCSHTGSGGSDIKARIVRAGYDASGWAECWAQTQTPQKAVAVWMNETPPNDPHRRTLLSDWLTEIGLGVSEADWGHYIIADFGRP